MENKTYALDKIDDRDYIYEEIVGRSNSENKEVYIIDRLDDYQNQGLETITKYMCVFYSSGMGNNIQNFLEESDTFTNCKNFGLRALKEGILDVKKGAYVQSGPKLLKKEGLIKGYAIVLTLDGVKDSLQANNPVVVGSNKIDWKKTKENHNIAVIGKSYGHAFTIIGYNDNKKLLTIKNSYGKDYGDKGRFYIKYEDFNKILFNGKYSLLDNEDGIISYKKKIVSKIKLHSAKIGFLTGLTNGQNLTQEKEETIAMIVRGLKFTPEFRKKYDEAEKFLLNI